MEIKDRILSNGVHMPSIMMGTSICDLRGKTSVLQKKLEDALIYASQFEGLGFDTARDYSNEELLGDIFVRMIKSGVITRDKLFVTTKVGNGQQRTKNMLEEIDTSLRNLKFDYIDLWLLHWPLPDYYIENWKQVEDIYKSGKVRAIGIANCRERHIKALEDVHVEILPHVLQFEYHPFRTVPKMVAMCREKHIQVEAYSANCLMLPFVKENKILQDMAQKYDKSVTQIIMRWHIQQNSIPIFRSFNPAHIKENVDIFDFELSHEDVDLISSLNMDYKFHPESINCPGY